MSSESQLRPLPQTAFSLTAMVTTVLPFSSVPSSLVRKSGFGVGEPSSAQSRTKGLTKSMMLRVSTPLPSTVAWFQLAIVAVRESFSSPPSFRAERS